MLQFSKLGFVNIDIFYKAYIYLPVLCTANKILMLAFNICSNMLLQMKANLNK